LVAGHHGGLPNRADLKIWLQDKTKIRPAQEAIQLIPKHLAEIEPPRSLYPLRHISNPNSILSFLSV
jgi:hypothetical protein